MATYAYALSPTGAPRLLNHILTDEPLFSRPIDHVYRSYITYDEENHKWGREAEEKARVMSFVPPIVGHGGRVSMGSEIGGDSNSWETDLGDSTMERLEVWRRVEREREEREREKGEGQKVLLG